MPEASLDDLLWIALDIHPACRAQSVHAAQATGLLTRDDLWHYQRHFVDLIKACFTGDPETRKPGAILALPPGAGKTGTVLTALRDLLDAGVIKKVLITAPLLVAKTVWPAELLEWAHLTKTTYTLIRAEDSDPEIVEVSERVYAEALARYQAKFDAEVAEASVRNPRKSSALAIVRAQWEAEALKAWSFEDKAKRENAIKAQTDPHWPEDKAKPRIPSIKATPGDFAERERAAAVAAAKEAMLKRLAAEPTELHIINKEALPWLWANAKKGRHWPYEAIVADDLREFRSGKPRSKGKSDGSKKGPAPLSRWGVLANARRRVIATIELTGTPTPKGLPNMWGITYLVDLGERLGLKKKIFLDKWFDVDRFEHTIEAKPNAFDEIMDRVKDIMFSLDEADLPKLPPFIIRPIRVKLPPRVMEEYKRFERDMISAEYDVEAVNGGVHYSKCLQFANGSMYQEDGNDIWVHDCKIDALKGLVEELDGTPLLVAYTFQFDVDRILKAFPKAVVLGPGNALQVVKDWNANKIPLLLANRDSAAHGLNMQKGIGHMCEYGLTGDAELYLQFIKRLLRPGRKSRVINHVIMAEGTRDEAIYPMYLNPKIEEQNQILQAVRVLFGENERPRFAA